jgi:lysophospholipase L1-like esterase
VALGDSLTEGIGDSTKKGGYLSYLASMLESDQAIRESAVYNFGEQGNRSDLLLDRLGSSEIQSAIREADIVTVTIGGNDVMKIVQENIFNLDIAIFQKEKSAYLSRVKGIIETIRDNNPDTAIILIGFYNPFNHWFSDISEMNEIVGEWTKGSKEVVEQYPHTLFVEIDELFLKSTENLLFEDNFHPNDRGYKLIAKQVFNELRTEDFNILSKNTYTVRKEENVD